MSKASYSVFRGELIQSKMKYSLHALAIAEDAHEGVLRNDNVTPYVEHPAKVASILFNLGVTDDKIIAAALLHDVVEDTSVDEIKILDEFKKFFPSDLQSLDEINSIIRMVSLVSKPKDKKEYNAEDYFHNISLNMGASLIKLADRVHNLSTVYVFKPERKNRYLKETEEYFYPLIKYCQHHYYEYVNAFRILDLWIESIVKNTEVCA